MSFIASRGIDGMRSEKYGSLRSQVMLQKLRLLPSKPSYAAHGGDSYFRKIVRFRPQIGLVQFGVNTCNWPYEATFHRVLAKWILLDA